MPSLPPATFYWNKILAEPCLVRFYEMQELTGTTAFDATGNENGAYSTGAQAPTLGEDGIPAGGYSVKFNGNESTHDSNLTVAPFAVGGTLGLTMESWIWFPDATLAGTQQVCSFSGLESIKTSSTAGILLEVPGFGNLPSNGNLTQGVWHHVVATLATSGSVLLYLDAVLQTATLSIGTVGSTGTAATFYVGGGDTYAFDAVFQICNVAVYNCPLNQSAVTAHYNAGITVPTSTSFGAALLAAYG